MFECHAPIAFYDGQLQPADQVAIPYWDLAYAQGVSIVEQLRTYGGRLPLVDYHLRRMRRGLTQLKLEKAIDVEEIRSDIVRVVDHNYKLLEGNSDLGVCVVVSAGFVNRFLPKAGDERPTKVPTVLIHSFPLPFDVWKDEFRRGVRLATTPILEISNASIPHDFKHRNRLHYFLAQQDVDSRLPGCRPILATHEGFVADSPTAGIVIYQPDVGWIAPLREHALHSVTVEVVAELATSARIGFTRRAITFDGLASAAEVICCSTPTALLPVIELDEVPIGTGESGPQYAQIAQLWTERVGLDFRAQALNA